MTELNQQAQLISINKQEVSNESLGVLPSLSSRAMFWRPKFLCESSLLDHLPFAFWLIESIKPKMLVELGVGSGASYFAFCQAMDKLNIDGRCYGIDQWLETNEAQLQYSQVQRYNKEQYEEFSRLVSDDWSQAAEHFLNNSIQLLHINTADKERPLLQIFQQWLPKLTSDAVVLLHHSQNMQLPQVQALKKQLQQEHRHFEFMQQHGLLVVAIKELPSLSFERLLDIHPGDKTYEVVQSVFSRLGKACSETMNAEQARKLVEQVSDELACTRQELRDRQLRIDALLKDLNEHKTWLSQRQQEVGQLSHQLSRTEQQKQQQQQVLNERVALLEKTRKELQQETENLFRHVAQLNEQKQQVAAQLLSSESDFKALQQQLEPMRQVNQQQKNELSQLQQDKAQMERQLKVQADDIEKLHQQLASITRTAEEYRLQLTQQQKPEHSVKIAELEAQLAKLLAELNSNKQTNVVSLAQLEKQLQDAKNALANSQKQLQSEGAAKLLLEKQLQELNATLTKGQQQLLSERAEKQLLDKQQQELSTMLANSQQQLSELQVALVECRQQLEIKAQHQSELTQQYGDIQQQLTLKQAELTQCYNELAELTKVVQQQQQFSTNKQAMLNAQVGLQNQKIRQLQNSLSWKLSWPLRAVARVFSKKQSQHKSLKQQLKLVEESGLFDQNWYLLQYPDVAQAKVSPLEHYVRFGGFEGRKPNPDFDSGFYLSQYQDVVDAGLNPLVHFIKFGRAEQRLFSAQAK